MPTTHTITISVPFDAPLTEDEAQALAAQLLAQLADAEDHPDPTGPASIHIAAEGTILAWAN